VIRRVVAGVVFLALLAPISAAAITVEELQVQVAALQKMIAAMQQGQGTATIQTNADFPDDYGTGAIGLMCPKLSITMQRGSRDATTGGQVSELQIFLSNHFGIDEDDIVTGYFGPTTERYVKRFQEAQRLPTYGIVGSLTRAAIARLCAARASIKASYPAPPPMSPEAIRDARRVSDLKQLQLALELYYDAHNAYPAGTDQPGQALRGFWAS